MRIFVVRAGCNDPGLEKFLDRLLRVKAKDATGYWH